MPKTERGGRGRSDRRNKPVFGERHREALQNMDENSPMFQSFKRYAAELDAKHDKHERLFKLSRDVTVESKRIIFLLHTIDSSEKKTDAILSEAKTRLNKIVSVQFQAIAEELKNEDPHQFSRAFTSGVQEFIEALTFYHYLENQTLKPWKMIQEDMEYQTESPSEEAQSSPIAYKMPLSPNDYMLGIADLTGELMRKCINSLAVGKTDNCFETCSFVRSIHDGFIGIRYTGNREFGRKERVLRQSLEKMEKVCYSILVRGSEVPKHVLADVLAKSEESLEEDEGFY